jgi:hypothetical protein
MIYCVSICDWANGSEIWCRVSENLYNLQYACKSYSHVMFLVDYALVKFGRDVSSSMTPQRLRLLLASCASASLSEPGSDWP